MKIIFKKNKQNKDGPVEQTESSSPTQNLQKRKRIDKKGFIAWPENTAEVSSENVLADVIEGRTKNGGYVALPK